MNTNNLQKGVFSRFNSERAAAAGRKSGEARRRKSNLKHTVTELLSMPIGSGKLQSLDRIKNLEESDDVNLTVSEKIALIAVKEAIDMNLRPEARAKARDWIFRVCEGIVDNGVPYNPFEELTTEELRKLANRQ